jgi:hypothetical protein
MIFKNIKFDIYNKDITSEEVKNRFGDFLNYIGENEISHIEICDKDQGYIFIEKEGKENKWDKKTVQMCDLLNTLNFDAFLSEEDYGYVDVIVLNNIFYK